MDLVVDVYKLSKTFPNEETYGLTSQMRRSAISIPSNIAEGSRRSGVKDTRHFFVIAFGSGAELETQLEIAKRLGFCAPDELSKTSDLLSEIMRMLNKMIFSRA